jgi:beta-carotene 3-hydroxylase
MNIIISAAFVLGAFFFMEFMAWFTHKYVMHGFLWVFTQRSSYQRASSL